MAKKPVDISDSPVAEPDEPVQTDEKPDPWVVLARLTTALETMVNRQAAAPSDTNAAILEKLGTAIERMAESGLAGSKLIADETRRAHRPSNEVVPGVSVFNRRGTGLGAEYQKPKLKCLMMIPWLVEWESITREEVELLNLLQPGDYQLKRIDGTKVRIGVRIDYAVDNVTPSRLVMSHETAFNNDNFKLIPGLVELLRQILRQHDPDVRHEAAAVLSDEEEEAMIEAGELSVSV